MSNESKAHRNTTYPHLNAAMLDLSYLCRRITSHPYCTHADATIYECARLVEDMWERMIRDPGLWRETLQSLFEGESDEDWPLKNNLYEAGCLDALPGMMSYHQLKDAEDHRDTIQSASVVAWKARSLWLSEQAAGTGSSVAQSSSTPRDYTECFETADEASCQLFELLVLITKTFALVSFEIDRFNPISLLDSKPNDTAMSSYEWAGMKAEWEQADQDRTQSLRRLLRQLDVKMGEGNYACITEARQVDKRRRTLLRAEQREAETEDEDSGVDMD